MLLEPTVDLDRAIEAVLFPVAAEASHALEPIAPHIRWNAPSENMLIFDQSGHLVPIEVGSAASTEPGPVSACGYLVRQDPITVPLTLPLYPWGWGVRIVYFTNQDSGGFITVDGDRQAVLFVHGLHSLTLIHSGTATFVTLESIDGPVCVSSIRVGDVAPLTPP